MNKQKIKLHSGKPQIVSVQFSYFDDSHKTEKRISIVIQRKRDETQHNGHQYMLRPMLY